MLNSCYCIITDRIAVFDTHLQKKKSSGHFSRYLHSVTELMESWVEEAWPSGFVLIDPSTLVFPSLTQIPHKWPDKQVEVSHWHSLLINRKQGATPHLHPPPH